MARCLKFTSGLCSVPSVHAFAEKVGTLRRELSQDKGEDGELCVYKKENCSLIVLSVIPKKAFTFFFLSRLTCCRCVGNRYSIFSFCTNPSNLSAGHYLNNFSSVVELRRINFHSHIELNIA